MPQFSAIFLGTGTSQGVPVIACDCNICQSSDLKDKRLRTSFLFTDGDKTVVIDTGPDFRQQMLSNDVKMVDAILFTHEHKDHVAGMDDIRSYNFKSNSNMPVYATKQVQGALKREFPYVFSDFKYPGIPKVELIEIEGNEVIKIGEMNITPIEVMHYKLPVTAFRVGGLSYITDANYISDDQRELIKGSDIIVINALRRENHISHFNLNQALEFIAEMNPRKAYLTHISHHMGLHKDVQKELPENVEIAYDGLKIDFG